jgi:hypothetical protein
MLKATVSGSFHRHIAGIYSAVGELRAAGVDVLSPSDPRIVDHIGEFLFVASDKLRSVRLVQDRHFEAIRASHFLWVVCPDGYTGPSTSAEIGFARAVGTPVLCNHSPFDITIRQYVRKVPSIGAVVQKLSQGISARRTDASPPQYLLDPNGAIAGSIGALETLGLVLNRDHKVGKTNAQRQVAVARRTVAHALDLSAANICQSNMGPP